MGIIADLITLSAERSRGYTDRLLKDVPASMFARRAPGKGDALIDSNHPAFVFGHLALYPSRVMAIAGLDGSALETPAHYEPLFKAGAQCEDDPKGTIYPPMREIVDRYTKGYDAAITAIKALPDAKFGEPNPFERYREFFPTVGIACNFLLNNHIMVHAGQVSAWRRFMGLPPA